MDIETQRNWTWLICTAGFITSSINYRVDERTGKTQFTIPTAKTIFIRKKKNTGKKHFGAFKTRLVGTIISITSEDNQV